METLIRKITSLTGFTNSAGVVVDSVAEGTVSLSLEKKEELTQFNGYFHGGVIAGLADHAAGAAATTVLPKGRIAVTIDMNINFMAPAKGSLLQAIANVEHSGSSIIVVTVKVNDIEHDVSSAIGTVTLKSVPAPEF